MDSIFLYRAPGSWKGKTFIFHKKPRPLQKFYYSNIIKKENGSDIHPSYNECAGKKVIVTNILPDGKEFLIELQAEDGTIYETTTLNGSIAGIIPFQDIEMAKKYFLNKSLWYLKTNILNNDTKNEEYYPVYAERYSLLEVIDVQPGCDTNTPVRLVLETPHQEEGFVDINLSGTNVPETIRNKARFNEFFSLENPAKWSPQIKKMIENQMIKKGMSCEQVRMSWGSSAEIFKEENSNKEKWLYPYGDILIFKNGKLIKTTKE